jgi:DMSO/TMAO reductase YedYZ heme-binding membrane subunit
LKSQVWWYVARSGGIVAWALCAISVVWGLLLSSRVLGRRVSGPKLLDLHRYLGGLAVVFTGVHIAGLVLDESVHFGFVEVLVPMASEVFPGAVAWGVVAFYLLIAVEVTSLLRRRIGERVWRSVHYASFAVFLLGTIHGLKAGTDAENPLIWWPAAAASAAIVGLAAARIFANGDPVPKRTAVGAEGPGAELLERTLAGLRELDDELPTVPVFVPNDPGGLFDEPFEVPPPPPSAQPPAAPTEPPSHVDPANPFADYAPPQRLTPEQAVSGSLFPSTDEARSTPGPLDLTVPSAFDDRARGDERTAPPWPNWPNDPEPGSGTDRAPEAPAPVTPSGAPAGGPPRDLPVRTPRRLARTTAAAASIDAWQPARATADTPAKAPPAPPSEIDPTTGEPDPQAYRKWLREWLAYVESQA